MHICSTLFGPAGVFPINIAKVHNAPTDVVISLTKVARFQHNFQLNYTLKPYRRRKTRGRNSDVGKGRHVSLLYFIFFSLYFENKVTVVHLFPMYPYHGVFAAYCIIEVFLYSIDRLSALCLVFFSLQKCIIFNYDHLLQNKILTCRVFLNFSPISCKYHETVKLVINFPVLCSSHTESVHSVCMGQQVSFPDGTCCSFDHL